MSRFAIPLAVFAVIVAFLFVGLGLNPREVPSPFIGKPAPAFQLAQLHAPDRAFTQKDLLGQVWLLNVWASWCISCRDEHPLLVELQKKGTLPILGLNYKDKSEDAKRWLQRFGDPYQLSVTDIDGRIGIDYGVYGVPETYLIDAQGVIRYKRIGVITPAILQEKILPLAATLKQ